jgi:hypothetical protein
MRVRILTLALVVIAASGCEKIRSFWMEESWKWSASGITETTHRGDIVCHAIEAYRAKNGNYPATLRDLQPDFLREIPQPTVGHKEWEYIVIDHGTNYWLQVVASEFGPILERNAPEHWYYIDDRGGRNI